MTSTSFAHVDVPYLPYASARGKLVHVSHELARLLIVAKGSYNDSGVIYTMTPAQIAAAQQVAL